MCSNDNKIRDVRHNTHPTISWVLFDVYLKYQTTEEMKNTYIFVNEFKSIARKKRVQKSKTNE